MANGNRLPPAANVLVEMTLVPRTGAAVGAAPAAAVGVGSQYRILRTLEVDAYEPALPAAAIVPMTVPRPAPADNSFRGTSRKAAKLSIAQAQLEEFDDINDLIASFPKHATMVKRKISTKSNSNRVDVEKRNVKVRAFLYAASLEDDNDYHLIIGRAPSAAAKYMTAEISGLPPDSSSAFNTLSSARDAYFNFFGDGLPGTSYDFYDPPIPIEIEGSLFWDASHSKGERPGPETLRPKMPVVWEIHPVTRIVFEP
jgi:hypothetical protein